MKRNMNKLAALFLCAVMLLTLVPMNALAYGSTATIGTLRETVYLEYKENGTWYDLELPVYQLKNITDVNLYAYALSPEGTDPINATYNAEALSASMSETVRNGIDLILDYGYPSVYPKTMSTEKAMVATQAAIFFWLAEKGMTGFGSYLNRRTDSSLLRAKNGADDVLAYADELLEIARAGAQPVRSVTVSSNRVVLSKNSDGSYSGSFDLNVEMIDSYWFSASGMPSVVTLSGSDSISDCTISISAPSTVAGSEFDLIITGYTAGDSSNYTVYRPTDSANKTLLYNEGKAVPVCEQSVHIVIPGSGRIRIYETNEEGGAVPYSVWGVYADEACTQEITRATQTTNGFTNTQSLDSDVTYYVRQISTVEPYLLDTSVYPVEVKAGQTNSLYITARKSTGKISVSAEGSIVTALAEASSEYGTVYTPIIGHGGVAGAVFTVTDENGNATEMTTDGNGQAVLSGLSFGTYTVVQTSAPTGIDYDSEAKTVTIEYAGSSVPEVTEQITVTNSQMSGQASFKKMTETYDRENRVFNPIAGTGFTYGLYSAEQNGLIPKDALLEVLTTDTNGEATSTLIPYGSYYFRELSVPNETIHMSYESYPFTLNAAANTEYRSTPFENDMHKGYVSVYLTDSLTGEPVEGAKFKVLGKDDGYVYDVFTTDATGYGTSCALPIGNYILVMEDAAVGYTLDTEQTEFSITTETKSAIVFEKTADGIRMQLTKTASDSGEGLANALLTVYKSNGEIWLSDRTDENGILTLDLIPYGTYTWKETEAPEGYALDSTVHTFTISSDGTVTGETTMTNSATALVISKTNTYTNSPMSGITFYLKDAQGKTVYTKRLEAGVRIPCDEDEGEDFFLTGSDGKIEIRYLATGNYTLEENVPQGYVSNAPLPFTLSAAHSLADPLQLSVSNTPTGLLIKKVDASSGNPLSGAGFSVKVKTGLLTFGTLTFTKQSDGSYFYSETGTETVMMVDGTGELKLLGLPVGDIWIEEAVTPEGYFPISAQKVEVTSSMTFSSPYEMTIKNSKYVKLGMDSDWWEFPALCIGILILAGGAVFFILKKRKKKEISVPFPR